MTRDPRLRELGAFLRARRSETAPADPDASRRQVPGLRREEVAAAVFISSEYYTRIEQGRLAPSAEVLARLATLYRLNEDQRFYARNLLSGEETADVPAAPDPRMLRLLDQLAAMPALLIGPGTAILAWNAAAAAMFVDFGRIPAADRTYVRLIFTDAEFQSRFRDLPGMRETVTGILRASGPPGQAAGLAAENAAFRELWERHDVTQPHSHLPIPLTHPVDGAVEVEQSVFRSADDPGQRLLLFARVERG